MNYNEFKDYVKEHVLDYLPEQFRKQSSNCRHLQPPLCYLFKILRISEYVLAANEQSEYKL